MENEIQIVNEGVANESGVANSESVNESVANSNSKIKITNKLLVELGLNEIITKNTYYWYASNWNAKGKDYDIQCSVYNWLYVLEDLYEKYLSKSFELSHTNDEIYVDNKEVFYIDASPYHIYKNQNLKQIKQIVSELLEKVGLQELKKELKERYEKEKAKIEGRGGREIADWHKFLEALANDKELSKKEVYAVHSALHFGRVPKVEEIAMSYKIKDILRKKDILSVHIYDYSTYSAIFIRAFTYSECCDYKIYAIKLLSENEKQKVAEIITSLNL